MKTIVLSVCVILSFQMATAQSVTPQVINTTGGTYKKGYYSLDWSVGELALVDQFKPAETVYIVTNGFLQSFTDSREHPHTPGGFERDEIIILPNPTSGRLEINFFIQEKGEARLTLYDAVGGQLLTRRVIFYGYGKFERLNLTGLAGSTYLLAIEFINSTGVLKKKGTYKILKIQ
jgi:hypothetical protein